MKKIGILGGTFNPVHIEHVNLALSAVKELNLDKLLVMPTYISPHKTTLPAPSHDRINMLKIAFNGYDKIEVCDYEIQKQGKSYTYLTVEYFKAQTGAEIYFIVGGDMLTDFKNWKYPKRILSACKLAVFDRQNVITDYDGILKYFNKEFNDGFIRLSYVGQDVSSTKMRVYVSFGLKIPHLPNGVGEYIEKSGLYLPSAYQKFVIGNLTEKRVKHTADVVISALKKAKALGLEQEKVITAATLHDVAKYMDYKKVKGFCLPDGVPEPVVHAFLGAYVAENVLGVTDEEILDAIRYHTSGKANMSLLSKLIFVADMVEEGRDYDGVDYLRKLYEQDDFEKCFVECLKEEVLHLKNKKQYIYVQTLNAFDYYVKDKN